MLASGSEWFYQVFKSLGSDCPNPLKVPDPAPLDKFENSANNALENVLKYMYQGQVSELS